MSGEIPPDLDNLTSLESLNLIGNQLSGCVADILSDRSYIISEHFAVCAIEDPGDKEVLSVLYIALGLNPTRETIYE